MTLVLPSPEDLQRHRDGISDEIALQRAADLFTIATGITDTPDDPLAARLVNLAILDMAWYLQTNVPNGLISFQRRALDLEKDTDFDTENRKQKATERYSAGWGDWRAVFGNAGA